MGNHHKIRPSHPYNKPHLSYQTNRPCRPADLPHARQLHSRTSRAMRSPLYCNQLLTPRPSYVGGNSLTERPPRLATACSRDGLCSQTNVQTQNVMGYLSFVRRNREVVRILERSVIGTLSYWIKRIPTMSQECVICGSVYVDEENLGDLDHSIIQPRASATGVDKDKGVQSPDILNPIKVKNNFTSRAAAIHLTVCCQLVDLFQQLKRVRRTQHPPTYLRRVETRGKHVHQTFVSLPPHVCTVHKVRHQQTYLRKVRTRYVPVVIPGISH